VATFRIALSEFRVAVSTLLVRKRSSGEAGPLPLPPASRPHLYRHRHLREVQLAAKQVWNYRGAYSRPTLVKNIPRASSSVLVWSGKDYYLFAGSVWSYNLLLCSRIDCRVHYLWKTGSASGLFPVELMTRSCRL
jgi:hypothetical protein